MAFRSVQFSCSAVSDSMDCSTPGLPIHHQLPELAQTHAHRVSDDIQPSRPLSSPSPPALKSFPASGSFPMSQVFASGSQSIGASALASVLPVNIQYWFPLGLTGLVSLQSLDWKTLKSLLQHHSSKASILQRSAFFTVQLSHPYMTTGKTIALTRRTFVSKVISLLFNKLSRLVMSHHSTKHIENWKVLVFGIVIEYCYSIKEGGQW